MRNATLMSMTALALFGTTASAQTVSYDYDRGTDFSRLKTYSWVPGTNLRDELNHKRIVAAVDAQLAAKGMTRVEAGADVLVAYHASFDRDLQINATSSDWGGYRWSANRFGSARVSEITTGTVIVDLVDAKSKTIIWRGTATKEVDTKADPEKRDRNVNRAAEKLFKNYPPAK